MPFTLTPHEHHTILSIRGAAAEVWQECGGSCAWTIQAGTYDGSPADRAALNTFAAGNPWPPEADLELAQPLPGVRKPREA